MRAHTTHARLARLTGAPARATVAPMFARSAALLLILVTACPAQPPLDESGSFSSSETDETPSSSSPDSTSSSGAEETSQTTGSETTGTGSSGTGSETSGDDSTSSGPTTDASSSSTGAPDVCGDGALDPGEECDVGGETKICDGDCTVPACGDLYVNPAAGEECDDGNVNEDDGCLSNCKLPICGDGLPQVGEACDDGNGVDGDGCDNDCTASWWEHEGVAYAVKIGELKGWTKCWEYTGSESIQSALSKCDQGEHLLVACAPMGEMQTLTMAAHGPRLEVTSGSSLKNPKIVNGAQWAYNSAAFGFAEIGVMMETSQMMAVNELNSYVITGLSYCNDYGMFRRVMFRR